MMLLSFLFVAACATCSDGFGVARAVTVDESMTACNHEYLDFVNLIVKRVLWSDKGYVVDPRKQYLFNATLGYNGEKRRKNGEKKPNKNEESKTGASTNHIR